MILSLIGLIGAVTAAMRFKQQLSEPPRVNQGDSLRVIINQTGESVEYVPVSNKK